MFCELKSKTKRTQLAVITGILACGTCAIEMHLTDTTDIVLRDVPSPCSYSIPFPDCYFHSVSATELFLKWEDGYLLHR
jgi:hypothetical protein